ncbi:hypothetical protein FF38_03047 [Lucilia cuprina]|uniref:Uncharacterized protein n=1 Tax=Lucilia cuprina TaxID=7375 RepID=A0A0L0CC24_LUCCU|nr:uncharacterized protein LOC111685936 [Lucilia cuprina]KNC29963.1 hypothetical protein FF38_08537 [Lucilia cuprina]KNC30028.1 hypothetical protein FF38_03047 [Lucilia cuprina]
MCPYYNQLNEIFGEKKVNGDFVVIDTGDVINMDDTLTESIIVDDCTPYDVDEEASTSSLANSSDVPTIETCLSSKQSSDFTQSLSTTISKKSKDFAEKLKKNAPKSSASHLAVFQAERTEMFKIRLEWEKEKHEKEIALSDRKLKLEEEKEKREMDFKVMQLEKEERLKILQIEKDERVQKFEIEMKYKSVLQN